MKLPNAQPISKQELNPDGKLVVHSVFGTIQGEGPFAGERSVFVRLGGCNLQCPLCDTDYTVTGIAENLIEVEYILESIKDEADSELVVLTGGEPFRQNIRPLVHSLLRAGHRVQIETNGTLFVDLWSGLENHLLFDLTVVCSPKTGQVNRELLPHVDALKYVLHADYVDSEDGLPLTALNHSAFPRVFRPPKGWEFYGKIYIHPVDSGDQEENKRHMKAAFDSAVAFGYTLGVQMHKIYGVP
jgi:organic radical activating enzyme